MQSSEAGALIFDELQETLSLRPCLLGSDLLDELFGALTGALPHLAKARGRMRTELGIPSHMRNLHSIERMILANLSMLTI